VARRYCSGLPNFAAHSPEDSGNAAEIPFCAPPAGRAEGTIPVQIEFSFVVGVVKWLAGFSSLTARVLAWPA
jgi:hypothetical protein